MNKLQADKPEAAQWEGYTLSKFEFFQEEC